MPGINNPTQQDIDQFITITQATPQQAIQFLSAGVTIQGAIEDYFAAQGAIDPEEGDDEDFLRENDQDEDELEEIMSGPQDQTNQSGATNPSTGGVLTGAFTLGGSQVDSTLPPGWGQPARNMIGRIGQWGGSGGGVPAGRRSGGGGGGGGGGGDGPRIATLGSLGTPNAPNVTGMGTDDMEELLRRRQEGNELYAGGERSGLAVQEPGRPGPGSGGRRGPADIVSNILQQARDAGPANPEAARAPSWFGGTGHTLGSDETPSTSIPDPSTADSGELEEAQRHLTFWRDGFSIEDGPLYRYDAPGTQDILSAIYSGRAPPSLFNVRFNQPLQLIVAERREEDYKPPPKAPMKAFDGNGNRLGSPVPKMSNEGSGANTPQMPGGMPSSPGGAMAESSAPAASSSAAPSSSFAVDDSKPTTSIQVRLGDGTRIVARVNLTHTVGDLRNFVRATDSRPFVLQTTFPNRELKDEAETIEAAKLANAVVIQRFT